jgi:DNA polymerase-3 subunit gamma/tau
MLLKTRAGKKKWLTDPVEIIPFLKSESQSPEASSVIPNETEQVKFNPQENPIPKKVHAPIGALSTQTLSIKKMMEKIEEQNELENDISKLPQKEFSIDDLKMIWRRYAFEAKEKGMETLYNALVKRDPHKISETSFELIVDNQVQVDYIQPYLPEIIGRFRKELENYLLDILIVMSEKEEEEDIKFLTGKDKFASLARKNPNLHTLKNTFNLDIDF